MASSDAEIRALELQLEMAKLSKNPEGLSPADLATKMAELVAGHLPAADESVTVESGTEMTEMIKLSKDPVLHDAKAVLNADETRAATTLHPTLKVRTTAGALRERALYEREKLGRKDGGATVYAQGSQEQITSGATMRGQPGPRTKRHPIKAVVAEKVVVKKGARVTGLGDTAVEVSFFKPGCRKAVNGRRLPRAEGVGNPGRPTDAAGVVLSGAPLADDAMYHQLELDDGFYADAMTRHGPELDEEGNKLSRAQVMADSGRAFNDLGYGVHTATPEGGFDIQHAYVDERGEEMVETLTVRPREIDAPAEFDGKHAEQMRFRSNMRAVHRRNPVIQSLISMDMFNMKTGEHKFGKKTVKPARAPLKATDGTMYYFMDGNTFDAFSQGEMQQRTQLMTGDLSRGFPINLNNADANTLLGDGLPDSQEVLIEIPLDFTFVPTARYASADDAKAAREEAEAKEKEEMNEWRGPAGRSTGRSARGSRSTRAGRSGRSADAGRRSVYAAVE